MKNFISRYYDMRIISPLLRYIQLTKLIKGAMRCLQGKPYKKLHVTAAKAAETPVLANYLRQRLFHVTQNIVWLHNSA